MSQTLGSCQTLDQRLEGKQAKTNLKLFYKVGEVGLVKVRVGEVG